MPPQIVPISSLDWPGSPSDLPNATVQRAGQFFLGYEARARGWLKRPATGAATSTGASAPSSSSSTHAKKPKEKPTVDLFSLSEDELSDLSYYEVLGNVPIHSTPDQLKKYYRKACLKYHPDKTGRGEEDAVFLAVKAAFETLSDPAKKKSYDSTLDFDESIPAGNESESEFYATYGPVFERNLRFDRRYDPSAAVAASKGGGGKGGKKKNKKKGGNKGGEAGEDDSPPALGDDSTPVDEVHAFYDYWTHFDSWRDFTLKASASTDHDIDMADSRDEQRWMKKEIDRKAKALKREEVARIALLVERAMSADPRLKREREREKEEKKRLAEEKERKRIEKERKEAEEKAKREKDEAGECIVSIAIPCTCISVQKTEHHLMLTNTSIFIFTLCLVSPIDRIEKEKQEKAAAKAKKGQEKKQLRKAKQLLWKLAVAAHGQANSAEEKVWKDIESMHDDVEVINTSLAVDKILAVADSLGGSDADGDDSKLNVSGLVAVKKKSDELQGKNAEKKKAAEKKREEDRAAAARKEAAAKVEKAGRPWTKKELSALAKAVKKYPPGGANRWDAIALFVNNLCKQKEGPRTREECIERYNAIAQGGSASSAAGGGSGAAASDSASADGGTDEGWTEKQDKFLQNGLAKYTARTYPDKNERWGLIADMVPGKNKKQCVARFKEIREALKEKKAKGK